MSDVAIRAEGLGKRYRIGARAETYCTLRDAIVGAAKTPFRLVSRLARRSRRKNTVWALKDVSFEIGRGEVVGVIGRNGAGKTTLLKILSRITKPTEGCAEIHGRVGSLLEVGTGFHPELTGRENIFLNGAVLGMTRREIRAKFDEIVAFSEVEKFIDTPVKRYSSGMRVRLAFAVAAHLEPEILLVDEVLAVGDVAFQRKCLGKMSDVAKGGRTVLFVSHNMAAIQQLTQCCLLLDEGVLVGRGASQEMVAEYLSTARGSAIDVYDVEDQPRRFKELGRQVEFLRLQLEDHHSGIIDSAGQLKLALTVRGNRDVDRFRFSLTVLRVDGTPVGSTFGADEHSIRRDEERVFRVAVTDPRLAPGLYYVNIAVGTGDYRTGHRDYDLVFEVLHFEVLPPEGASGTSPFWAPSWGPTLFPRLRLLGQEAVS